MTIVVFIYENGIFTYTGKKLQEVYFNKLPFYENKINCYNDC